MQQKKQQNEDPIVQMFRGIGNFIGGAVRGAKSLSGPLHYVLLAVSLIICAAAVIWREQFWAMEEIFGKPAPKIVKILLWIILVLLPIIYMNIVGSGQKEEAIAFKEIGFVGKNGEEPTLVYVKKQKKGERAVKIMGFQSFIPLEKWRNSQAELETALNSSIRSIAQGKDKRTVEIATISSELTIPDNIAWSDEYLPKEEGTLCVGVDQLQPVTFNLNKTPHALVAGETGSGKSVILRTILWQAINSGCRIFMVDFKGGVEFGKRFEQYGEVIMNRKRALQVFQMLVAENTERLHLFREMEVKNLPEYNRKTGRSLCRIMVFIDEIAEMLDKTGVSSEEKEIMVQLEGCLSTLARLSRATGINLIIGVQRPDAKVLTGQIKNNVPVRICGRFADRAPSEIVLGNSMAMYLPETKGRFLYRMGNDLKEFQAYLFDDDKHLKEVELTPGEMLIASTPMEDEGETAPWEEIREEMREQDEPGEAEPVETEKRATQKPRKKRQPKVELDDEEFSFDDFDDIEEGY